ncbi:MAG: DJ-1/PfpI family protein [Calditrichaceae bacterium]|nr:DJ-1/PfpI family protein [Calditrichia bacterium]NUQ43450.1 DJ-1/PfpI family protein [Calditrichaceae bacterium]
MASLDGKQVVIILGQKNYNDQEFDYLFERLQSEGADVCVASNTLEKALGRINGHVAPDCTIEDVDPREFAAVVLIGGYGARVYLWDDEKTHELLRKFLASGKIIAAISTAPVALANAGILQNKKATVYPDYVSIQALESQGANHTYDNVIVDDNIITASDTRFVEKFADAIIRKLKG